LPATAAFGYQLYPIIQNGLIADFPAIQPLVELLKLALIGHARRLGLGQFQSIGDSEYRFRHGDS
jgi:hypothetical protein